MMYEINADPLLGLREPFSVVTHFAGALVFGGLSIGLLRRARGNPAHLASLFLLAYSFVQMLVVSSLYHMSWPGPTRELMLRLDVAGIFLVIAGSMTPVHVILFRGYERWIPLAIIWTATSSGMVVRMLYFDRIPGGIGIGIFLVLGWLGAVTASVLWIRYGWRFIRNAIFSGLAFTAGASVLLFQRPFAVGGVIGPHEIWHLAVLAGLTFHWRFIGQFHDGSLPEAVEPVLLVFRAPSRAVATQRDAA